MTHQKISHKDPLHKKGTIPLANRVDWSAEEYLNAIMPKEPACYYLKRLSDSSLTKSDIQNILDQLEQDNSFCSEHYADDLKATRSAALLYLSIAYIYPTALENLMSVLHQHPVMTQSTQLYIPQPKECLIKYCRDETTKQDVKHKNTTLLQALSVHLEALPEATEWYMDAFIEQPALMPDQINDMRRICILLDKALNHSFSTDMELNRRPMTSLTGMLDLNMEIKHPYDYSRILYNIHTLDTPAFDHMPPAPILDDQIATLCHLNAKNQWQAKDYLSQLERLESDVGTGQKNNVKMHLLARALQTGHMYAVKILIDNNAHTQPDDWNDKICEALLSRAFSYTLHVLPNTKEYSFEQAVAYYLSFQQIALAYGKEDRNIIVDNHIYNTKKGFFQTIVQGSWNRHRDLQMHHAVMRHVFKPGFRPSERTYGS